MTALRRADRRAEVPSPRGGPGIGVAFVRAMQAVNSHDPAAMSRALDALFDPGVLMHPRLPGASEGVEAVMELFASLRRAFPDLHVRVDDVIEVGDRMVCRNTVTGTHRGEHLGVPPTGRPVRYTEIFIARVAGGRIAEMWGVVDMLSQLRQLGVSPV